MAYYAPGTDPRAYNPNEFAVTGGYSDRDTGYAGPRQNLSFAPSAQPMQAPMQAPAFSGMSNPYLGGQAQAIADQATQNLRYNVLPGINSGAVAAGGFGGSRHGIAQGLAIGQTQQGISNALSNLYGNAYANDQNLANQYGIAAMGNKTTMRGQDMSTGLGYAGLENQRSIADQQTKLGYAGLANQREIADLGNETTRRGQDMSTGLGYAGLGTQREIANQQNLLGYAGLANQYGIANMGNQTQRDIAGMNNDTTRRGQDQSYSLGLGNLGLGYGNLENARQQTANQFNLGQQNIGLGYGNLENHRQQTANQFNLGQQNIGLGYAGLGNQYNIAAMGNDTTRRGQDQNFTLGLGNLGLGFQNSAQNYDLGLRSNDLGYATLDANIAQNNFGNQLAAGNFGLNAYNALINGNNAALTAANNIQQTPLSYYSQFSNLANGIGNGFGTTTQSATMPGNPLMGALGGYQLGNQFNSMFSPSGTTFTPDSSAYAFGTNYWD